MDELFEKLVRMRGIRCSLHVTMQAVNNFLGVIVTKANEFQTKISLNVVPESTKTAYIWV